MTLFLIVSCSIKVFSVISHKYILFLETEQIFLTFFANIYSNLAFFEKFP